MKILFLAILVFVATSKRSYSITTDEVEILESKGFHVISPPPDSDFVWEEETLDWLAFYNSPDKKADVLIPRTKVNSESLRAFEEAIEEYLHNPDIHPSLPPPISMIKEETATSCLLQRGDPVRILGFSKEDSKVLVEAHAYIGLNSSHCEETEFFTLQRENLGKPSERGIDVSHIGQIVFYNKRFQWVEIVKSWQESFIYTVLETASLKGKDRCNISYGEPVKILESLDELLVFVESQYFGGGSSCGKGDRFQLSKTDLGKLIHFF